MSGIRRLRLKIVPDAQPNADGEWIAVELPRNDDPYKVVPRPGWHVVRAVQDTASSLQDGGPMHAQFLRGGS